VALLAAAKEMKQNFAVTHHTSRLPCSSLSRRRKNEQAPDAGGGLYRGFLLAVKWEDEGIDKLLV
jgi:hypothetical protein